MPSGPSTASPSGPSSAAAGGQQAEFSRGRHPLLRYAREWGPWLVVIATFFWIGHVVKWRELYAVMRNAPIVPLLLGSAVFLLLNCAADTFATLFTFKWFGCYLPFRELYVVRAATYLLALVQYYVGQAALVAFLHQRKRVPILQGSGWILFISGINMGVLLLMSGAGLLAVGATFPWLRSVSLGIGALIVLYAALIQWKPAPLTRLPLLAPLFEMGIWGHVRATAVRVPHVTLLVGWHYFMMRGFGVNVPPLVAMALLPVVFFAAAIPISPQGLGLSQAAAVLFFTKYTDAGETGVLAYSLGTASISLLMQAVMGLGFLGAARRLGIPEHPIEEMNAEAAEDAAAAAPLVGRPTL